MFCPLEYRESMLICRGLVILFIMITLGVSVSQQQLNSLTHRQESMGGFYIAYEDNGSYAIQVLGSNYHIKAVYSIGKIINGERAIIIKTTNQSVTIPTYIELDCKKELILLDRWAKLLVVEAFKLKQIMGFYLITLQEKINVYASQFR